MALIGQLGTGNATLGTSEQWILGGSSTPGADADGSTTLDPVGNAQALAATANPATSLNPTTQTALVTGTSGLTPQTVSALLGYNSDVQTSEALTAEDQARASQDQAAADEQGVAVQGYQQQEAGYREEQTAYTTAAGISAENARLAVASGQVQNFQNAMQLRQTVGAQQASVASNGFGGGGSALAIYAQSMRQGALTAAMTNMQANVNAAGFNEQGAASQAEAAAVGVAALGADTAAQEAKIAQGEDQTAVSYDQTLAGQAATAGTTAGVNQQNLISDIANGTVGTQAGVGGPIGIGSPTGGPVTTASATPGPSGVSPATVIRTVNNGGTNDAADAALGGTTNLDPTGAGLL